MSPLPSVRQADSMRASCRALPVNTTRFTTRAGDDRALRLWRAVWLAVALLAPRSVLGGPSAERADVLFREGQLQLQAGNVRAACGLLAASHSLDPALGTLLNLALCHQTEGKLATALSEFTDALRWAEAVGEIPRANYARERMTMLTYVVPRIRISASGQPTNLVVELDGHRVDYQSSPLGFAVDPGRHSLLVTAAGRVVLHQDPIDIPVGVGTIPIAVENTNPAPLKRPVAVSPARRLWGLTAMTLGAFGIAGGTYFLLRAKSLDNKSHAEANAAQAVAPTDPALKRAALNDYDAAIRSQRLGLVSGGLGLASVGLGLVLLVVAEPAADRRLRPALALALQGTTFLVTADF